MAAFSTELTTIDSISLSLVTGGDGTTQTTGGHATLRGPGGLKLSASVNTTTSEPSEYLRCLSTVYGQRGWFEGASSVEARQERLCGPLRRPATQPPVTGTQP